MDGRAYGEGQSCGWARSQVFLTDQLRKCLLMNFKYCPEQVRRLFQLPFQLNILREVTVLKVPQNLTFAVLGKERIQINIHSGLDLFRTHSILSSVRLSWDTGQFLKGQEERIRKLKCYTNLAKKDSAIKIRHTRGNWLKEQTGSQELSFQLSSQKSEPVKRGL